MYHMVQQQNKLCLDDDEASDESTQSTDISPQPDYILLDKPFQSYSKANTQLMTGG